MIALGAFSSRPAGYHRVSAMPQGASMFKSENLPSATEKGRVEKETGPQTAPEPEKPSGQHTFIPAELQITGDLVSTGDIHVEA